MHKYSFSLATKFFPDCGMTRITVFFPITVCQRNFFVRNEFFKIFVSENNATHTYWYMGMTETGTLYFIFGKKECSLVSDISGYLSILLFFPQNVYLTLIWYQKGFETIKKKLLDWVHSVDVWLICLITIPSFPRVPNNPASVECRTSWKNMSFQHFPLESPPLTTLHHPYPPVVCWYYPV